MSRQESDWSNSKIPHAEALLSAKEVAAWLGVSETWIRSHAAGQRRPKQPEIPCLRLGSNVRFRREAIDDWLNQLAIAAGGRR